MNTLNINHRMQDAGLLLMRGVLGAVFVFHGSQKLFGWFGGYGLQGTGQWMESVGIPFGQVSAGLAGSIEFFGGLLLVAGIATRLVTLPMVGAMILAAVVTASQGFDVTQGGNEYAITMAVVLAGLGLIGSGRWTLPEAISRARNARNTHIGQVAALSTVALIALGLGSAGVDAQTRGGTMINHDEAQIALLLDRYETALNASDVDAVVEIEVHGDVAFARTGSKGTVRVLADGTSAPEENREFFVLEKRRGAWKITRYMFNKAS